MAANMRCAGRPVVITERESPTEYDIEPPCGWEGVAHGLDSIEPYEIEGVRIVPAELVTRLHCPDCGGRVELIAKDQGSGGVW